MANVRRSLLPVVVPTAVAGSVAGAEVLLHTGQLTFLRLLPWLLLFAALVFWASGPVSRWLRCGVQSLPAHDGANERPMNYPALTVAMLPICFYIGYFGCAGRRLPGHDGCSRCSAWKTCTSSTP